MMLSEFTILEGAVTLSLFLLIIALFLTLFRLVRGPSLPDRVVALNLLSSLMTGIIICYTVLLNDPTFLGVAVALALVSFLGTVAFARYLERSSDQ